jgi:predicted RNase H-like HicB family nuclease
MGTIPQGDVMSLYHVLVQHEEGWYIGRVMERPGITTQGKSLDELVLMLRDAIELMWNERNVALELVLSANVARASKRQKPRRSAKTKRRAA